MLSSTIKSQWLIKNDFSQEFIPDLFLEWIDASTDQFYLSLINDIIIYKMSIQPILQAERKKNTLPVTRLSEFLYGGDFYHSMRAYLDAAPVGQYTPNIYNKSRLELIKDAYKYLPMVYNYNQKEGKAVHPHIPYIYSFLVNPHQEPAVAHSAMFLKYIDLMGTQQHRKTYLEKCRTYQIVGCYAQSEVGHGSDIRGLQTTATFDEGTQEWILNSPSISSAKYWPGQLSFLATYAMVFAQAIVKGKFLGVYPFVVRIKDQDHNWLPNIEGGDIGPKIGFHAKQNGYMLLHNIRVPKDNLLNKYVQISNSGEITSVGDPRIGYGTMMHVRELISCAVIKLYALAIIIAARYSLYRKQFRDAKKQEIPIIEYQAQQDKVISRIAEYYAVSVASTRIRLISESNSKKVLVNDFSLLQETHSNLAFSKCLFSEIVQDGIESCRRSMGGHGTSYYSGIPQLMNEYAANNTHEGQNTVMYLQSAKYVLKSYGRLLKAKPLSDSVQYLSKLAEVENTKFDGQKQWTLHDLRTLLLKSIHHVLTVVVQRLAKKQPGQTQADIINFKVGLRLQQLAQLHGVHYMVDSFISAIEKEQNGEIRDVLSGLCALFAINQVHRLAEPIIEGGFVSAPSFSQLQVQKDGLLKKLRPLIAGLLDSFGIPQKYLRSELVSGHPYENFLQRARECELNGQINESQLIVSRIKDVLAAKPRL